MYHLYAYGPLRVYVVFVRAEMTLGLSEQKENQVSFSRY